MPETASPRFSPSVLVKPGGVSRDLTKVDRLDGFVKVALIVAAVAIIAFAAFCVFAFAPIIPVLTSLPLVVKIGAAAGIAATAGAGVLSAQFLMRRSGSLRAQILKIPSFLASPPPNSARVRIESWWEQYGLLNWLAKQNSRMPVVNDPTAAAAIPRSGLSYSAPNSPRQRSVIPTPRLRTASTGVESSQPATAGQNPGTSPAAASQQSDESASDADDDSLFILGPR